ncbi:MAG: MarR family transcriptional regulator [Promethearchaeota archaeon]
MTRQDLIDRTYLPPRTINYGLSRLKDLGLIRELVHGEDKRRMVYELISAPM